jgi:hypothetical protein
LEEEEEEELQSLISSRDSLGNLKEVEKKKNSKTLKKG